MKTYSTKLSEVKRAHHVIDASGQTLGRLASQITPLLMGKNKPIYAPNLDTGDFVVVINVEKVVLIGNKLKDKKYYHHTGYPGGIREISAEKLLAKKPTELLKIATKGMLPKNSLGRQMFKKLKVYVGFHYPHDAQNLVALEM